MAAWIGHLRIANALLEAGFNGDVNAFLVGSVAPDTGFADDFDGDYQPPRSVSHFHDAAGHIDPEAFYARYLAGQAIPEARRSFLIGYYLHLIADIYWHQDLWTPRFRQPEFAYRFEHETGFLEMVYHDVDGSDFLYLHRHPTCIYFSHLRSIASVPDYLDIFPAGALTTQLRRLCQRLDNPTFDFLTHPYSFVSPQEIDAYLESTTQRLTAVLREKDWL
jgi:hypothetical protein